MESAGTASGRCF